MMRLVLVVLLGLPGSSAWAQEAGVVAHRTRMQATHELPAWLQSARVHPLFAPMSQGRELQVELAPEHGARVSAGQLLVRFSADRAQLRLQNAEQRLALAGARLVKYRADLDLEAVKFQLAITRADLELERARLKAVSGVGLNPRLLEKQARLDRQVAETRLAAAKRAVAAQAARSKAELAVRQLALKAAERVVDRARAGLQTLEFRAPAGGLVRWRADLTAGAWVEAGELLMEICESEPLVATAIWVGDPIMAFRPETKAKLLFPGMPELSLSARLTAVEGACPSGAVPASRPGCGLSLRFEPRDVSPRVRAKIGPEMGVMVQLRLTLAEQALVVPAAAVVQRDGRSMVWCLEPPEPGWLTIETGRATPELVEVRAGLEEGMRVSLNPAQAAADQPQGPGIGPSLPIPPKGGGR